MRMRVHNHYFGGVKVVGAEGNYKRSHIRCSTIIMASSSTVPALDDSKVENCDSKIDSSPQSIIVIRHGQDDFDRLWQSKAARYYDAPLTEKGVEQAKDASKRFLDKDMKFIVSSPFLRCLQTAQYICDTLGLAGVYTCNSIVDVLDRHCGFIEQPVVPADDIAQLGIKVLELDTTDLPRFPEKKENGFERLRSAFNKLADLYSPHNIVIVTHGYGVQLMKEREGGKAVRVDHCSHVELQRVNTCSHQWTIMDSKGVSWSH